jgi:hypothetical protein
MSPLVDHLLTTDDAVWLLAAEGDPVEFDRVLAHLMRTTGLSACDVYDVCSHLAG